MRAPTEHQLSKWLPRLSLFVLGMIVGMMVYNALFHYNFNHLVTENALLRDEKKQMQDHIAKLQTYKNKQTVIKTIRVIVEKSQERAVGPDKLAEEELKKQVREDLKVFIGEDIYDIASNSRKARLLLADKIYPNILNDDYRIAIKTMLAIDGTLQVWITAERMIPKN